MTIRMYLAAFAAAALSACGGGSVDPATSARLDALAAAPAPCMPAAQYRVLIAADLIRPLPADALDEPGTSWHDPWLLVPAVEDGQLLLGERIAGSLVVVNGPDGLPKNLRGLYYVAGDVPAWVCNNE